MSVTLNETELAEAKKSNHGIRALASSLLLSNRVRLLFELRGHLIMTVRFSGSFYPR